MQLWPSAWSRPIARRNDRIVALWRELEQAALSRGGAAGADRARGCRPGAVPGQGWLSLAGPAFRPAARLRQPRDRGRRDALGRAAAPGHLPRRQQHHAGLGAPERLWRQMDRERGPGDRPRPARRRHAPPRAGGLPDRALRARRDRGRGASGLRQRPGVRADHVPAAGLGGGLPGRGRGLARPPVPEVRRRRPWPALPTTGRRASPASSR